MLPIADGQSLKADLRYARTSEDGKSGIDNRAISGMLTYSLGYNSFGLGYQKMSGDTGYAYLAETDPFLTNYVQVRDFAAQDEKSWQARYDYNFAGLGVPGLNFMTRYVRGSNIHILPACLAAKTAIPICLCCPRRSFENLGVTPPFALISASLRLMKTV